MKRILLTAALFIGVANFQLSTFSFQLGNLAAQELAYEFATADGTIVPDGSIVTITTAHEADDGSGDIEMPTGLFAKNVDGDADDLLRIAFDVQTMESGLMQICFPSACASINSPRQGATQPGKMSGNLHSIATEWFPTAYGKCTAKLSLQTVVKTINDFAVIDDGPTITLQFVYADPASVASAVSVATPVAYYSLSGQRLSGRPHGMALVRLSNGKVVKRMVK